MDESFRNKIIEPIGFIVAIIIFILSMIFFYTETLMFTGSLFAALITSGLTWTTYIILRWALLAFREKNQ